jgi:hypothetical protein
MAAQSIRERLWAKIDVRGRDECWPWTAATRGNGYGAILVGRSPQVAHRLVYEMEVGPIPDGHEIRHKCDNPGCCNPAHLETGTHRQNILDTRNRVRAPNDFPAEQKRS